MSYADLGRAAGGTVVRAGAVFGATTPDLLDLRAWLTTARVTHVVMES
jgi:hypothetical protein